MKHSFEKTIEEAALCTGLLYCINRTVFALGARGKSISGGQSSSYHWKYGEIHYTKAGKGSPVLLIHSLNPFFSGNEWEGIRGKLAQMHTVYVIDLPGCGRSQKRRILYTNFLYADAVCCFVRDVIGSRTDVITSGDSSSIAVMADRRDPSLFRKFIMINPETLDHMSHDPGLYELLLSGFMRIPVFGTSLYLMMTSRSVLRRAFHNYYFPNPTFWDEDMLAQCYASAHRGGGSARFSCSSIIGGYTRLNVVFALKTMKKPVYLIGGADTPDIRQTLEGYRFFNKKFHRELISQANRMPHLEFPGKTAARILYDLGQE